MFVLDDFDSVDSGWRLLLISTLGDALIERGDYPYYLHGDGDGVPPLAGSSPCFTQCDQ